jgi:hypothetical protein
MRLVLTLLAVALSLACAPRVPIEGAPCPCGQGFVCIAEQCVPGTGGTTGSPGPGSMPMGSPAATPADGGPPLPPSTCSEPGPAVMRRLTPEEYRNTVLDLTGVPLTEREVPDELADLRAVRWPATPGSLEALLLVAENVSARAIARPQDLLRCAADQPGSNTCAREFITSFGARAYRRPLADDEQMILLKAFEAGRSAVDFLEGIRRVIEVALAAPQFLYRIDLGEPAERSDVTPLTQWEIATRLSYLLWVSMPDEPLRQAAASRALATREGIRAEVQRMLRDPRVERTKHSFFERWLEPSAVRTAPKPPEKLTFNVELREALVTSARMTFSRTGWAEDQRLLFALGGLWADANMARFYGLAPPAGPGFAIVQPAGDQKRFGLLTYPALLASHANGEETSPVARGILFVREVMCTDLAPPPANAEAVLPTEVRPGATMRERMEEHSSNPACSICHQLFDPVGLGLENYDGYGVWRTHDKGQPINTAGKLLGADFDGPGSLAALLGESLDVSNCMVEQWFRYTFGRDLLPTDGCTLKQLKTAFMREGRSFQALLQAVVETDAFRTRTVTVGGGL